MSEQGFFAASMDVLHRIVARGGDASDLVAYIVLAKHTSGWGANKHMLSTAGAKAISNKTGLTYRQAEKRLKWLEQHRFIQANSSDKSENKQRAVRWILTEGEGPNPVYLAHSLIEGIGAGKNNPPLMRIWNEAGEIPGQTTMEARTDALLLLMHCYAEQRIRDYGGVDPRSLSIRWEQVPGADMLDGLEDHVWEFEQSNSSVSPGFVMEVLSHEPDQERRVERFWKALDNLCRIGMLYEVVEVWHGNPCSDDRAELFYPLYVRDYHARQNGDPYCLRDVHNYINKTLLRDGSHFMLLLEEAQEHKTLRLVPSTKKDECVIGTYRIRYRPPTKDVARGFEEEKVRASKWSRALEKSIS